MKAKVGVKVLVKAKVGAKATVRPKINYRQCKLMEYYILISHVHGHLHLSTQMSPEGYRMACRTIVDTSLRWDYKAQR